jgi:hypothetical protein
MRKYRYNEYGGLETATPSDFNETKINPEKLRNSDKRYIGDLNKMGKHKEVMCNICFRNMRSNNLIRQKKSHGKREESKSANVNEVYSSFSCNTPLTNEVMCRKLVLVDSVISQIATIYCNTI